MSAPGGWGSEEEPTGDGRAERVFVRAEASDDARVFVAAGSQYVVEVRDLHVTFVARDGRIDRVDRPTTDEECPYPGLAPFGLDQAGWFFGRKGLVADLTVRLDDCLSERTPLVVVAPSGTGKTSLLRAGLLPAVERGDLPTPGSRRWQRVVFTPTDHPMAALTSHLALLTADPDGAEDPAGPPDWRSQDRDLRRAGLVAALARNQPRGDARIVVIVDQLEEVFAQCEDDEERRAFIEELAWLTDPGDGRDPIGLVVLGLRADFYAHCADYPWLRTALQQHQLFLGPMSRSELRDAIVLPAQEVGLDVEPGLVEILLRDLGAGNGTADAPDGYEAGRLPLLAHALRATWQNRHDGRLTVSGYETTRGIEHAVAATAERAFERLADAEQAAAKNVFLRLVTVIRGSDDSRRRVLRADLLGSEAEPEAVRKVLGAFTKARLLTQDRDTVAITHEVLLRAWPRLRQWIDSDRVGNIVRQELRDAASSWDRGGRDDDLLYRRSQLDAVEASAPDTGDVDHVTRAFLVASNRRVKRAARIRRRVTAVLVTLALLASGAAVFAFQQRGSALAERDDAIFNQITGEADRLRTTDSALAAQLDAVAYRMNPTPDLYSHLVDDGTTPLSTPVASGIGVVVSVALTPDGRTLAAGGNSNSVRLWNLADPSRPVPLGAPLPVHADIVESVAFSPDGRLLAAGGNDGTIRLWNVADPARPVALGQPVTGHTSTVGSVAFSPDGRILASGSADKTIRLWNVADPTRPVALGHPLTGHTDTVASVVFRADGKVLASGSFDHTVRLWNVADPAHPVALGPGLFGHGDNLVSAVAFSPDGHTLASGGADNRVRLWNVADPAHAVSEGQLLGDTGSITSLSFSRSGQTLASGSYDGSVKLWNVAFPANPVARGPSLVGHTGPVLSLAFGGDGRTLVSGSADDTLRVWSLPPRLIASSSRSIASVALSSGGHLLATGSTDRRVRLWSVTDPTRPTLLAGPLVLSAPADIRSLAFSPDGHVLADGSDDGAVYLWNTGDPARTGVPEQTLAGTMGRVMSVAFSPDGRTLAAAGWNGQISLWNVTDPARPTTLGQPLTGHTGPVVSVAFSPDGHTLASGSADKTIRLWNVTDPANAAPLGRPLTGHTGFVLSVAFSPDSRTLASAGQDSTIRFWNVTDPAEAVAVGRELVGHTSSILSVAFDHSGRVLASGGADGTVRLWDMADPLHPTALGQPLTGPYSSVESLGFDRDSQLVTGGEDGVIRLWDLDADDAVRWICASTRNVLTPQQWHAYVPHYRYDPPCR
ncbi:hypothetical protein ACEZCY_22100 [Streptacidiphilus sp. N1-12]|uniref:Novel STAND NTPase 1 domain-containing protein n=2 Tax=Streptacidiphilus alkalitolerans TaxID=3342712 RepID=A0ABV6WIN4_9ACTN